MLVVEIGVVVVDIAAVKAAVEEVHWREVQAVGIE